MKYIFQLLLAVFFFGCGRAVVAPLPIPSIELPLPIPVVFIPIDVLPTLHPHFTTLDCSENGAIVLLEIGKLDSVPKNWFPVSYDIYYKKLNDSTYSHIAYNFEGLFKEPILMYADRFKFEISFRNIVTGEVRQSKYRVDDQDFEYEIECNSDKPLSFMIKHVPNLHSRFKKQSKYSKRISRSIAKAKKK